MFQKSLYAIAVLCLGAITVLAQNSYGTRGDSDSESLAALENRFNQLSTQYRALLTEFQGKASQTAESAELREKLQELVAQLESTGIKLLKQGKTDNRLVNETLRALAMFHLGGDAQGEGGDQYEKALQVIQPMLEAGLGDQWHELWLWGGLSAMFTNHYELAKQYFAKAENHGLLGEARPSQFGPRSWIWERANRYYPELQPLQREWQREQQLREAEAAADDLPRVKLKTTKGPIVIELFENEAPQTVANFLTLVRQGFYDGVAFHRVLPGFMAQGGDPEGTGSGGPGYRIRDEHSKPDARKHFRGSLSMANTGRPNTGGSQFFLTFVPTRYLNDRHTVFGRVAEGMEVAASLKRRDPTAANPPEADRILKASVLRDRGHGYEFDRIR